jgi:hypothetical protein
MMITSLLADGVVGLSIVYHYFLHTTKARSASVHRDLLGLVHRDGLGGEKPI